MSFCYINIFLHFLFARQNANKSLIHEKNSLKNISILKKKPLKRCKKNNKIKLNKNIERVQGRQHNIYIPKRKKILK
jgi:hypothetical protein